MDQLDSTSPNLSLLMAILSPLLLWLGYLIDGIQGFWIHYKEFFEFIKFIFECFAWGGGGTIGLVAFVKLLQDNGFIPKGKSK